MFELRNAPVGSVEELERLVGEPIPRVAAKERQTLDAVDREWLAVAPLVFVGTADASGACDVSPKGDPRGVAHVLDDRTVVIPERPGNRRVDGFRNILENPHVGLDFVIPGRGDTLRIAGYARIAVDEPFFDELVVRGHRPTLALVVDIETVFFHCSKAFLRSQTWDPSTWHPDDVTARAGIAKAVERPDESLDELERYYGERYGERLY